MKVTSANADSKSVHVACIFIFVLWCNVRQHSLDNNVDSQLLSNNRYLLRVVFVHLGRIKRCLIFYRARNEIIIRAGSVGAGLQRGGRGGGGLLHLAQCNTHWPPNIYIISTCTYLKFNQRQSWKRIFAKFEVSQSRRRPLLGPSPCWKLTFKNLLRHSAMPCSIMGLLHNW